MSTAPKKYPFYVRVTIILLGLILFSYALANLQSILIPFSFALFLGILLYYARKDPSRALFPALICMMLCFIANPSFIMIYIWAFMGLPVADYIQHKKQQKPASPHENENKPSLI